MLPRFFNSVDWIQLWFFKLSQLLESTSPTIHKGVLGSILKFLQVLQGFLNISYTTGLSACSLHRGNIQSLDRIWSLRFFLICACKRVHLEQDTAEIEQQDFCVTLYEHLSVFAEWGSVGNGMRLEQPFCSCLLFHRSCLCCTSQCSPVSCCARLMCCQDGFILKPGVEQIRDYSMFAGIFPASGAMAASQFGSWGCLPREEAEPGSR